MSYETILVEQRGAVTLVTLNRPQALNALNSQVLKELIDVFAAYDADDGQHCLVLTGSEKAFAAGADIKEMSSQGFADMYSSDFFAGWEKVTATRKPWIAAVAGYALGGGCEVAMMADFIIAADSAKFGQPEIKLGVTPGMGGSQRLTWAVGKAKAMEMCLTGRMMDAEEAERSGLVAKVVPAADLLDEAHEDRRGDRRHAAARRDRDQGNGQRRLRNPARPGHPLRAPPVPRPVRHRGPEGRHGRLRREAAGQLEGTLDAWRRSHSSASATWVAEWRRTSPRRGMRSAPSTWSPKRWSTRVGKAAARQRRRPPKRSRTPTSSSPCFPPRSMSARSIDDDVAPNAKPGALLIDCSTIDVASAREVGEAMKAQGLRLRRRAGFGRHRRGCGRNAGPHGRRHRRAVRARAAHSSNRWPRP